MLRTTRAVREVQRRPARTRSKHAQAHTHGHTYVVSFNGMQQSALQHTHRSASKYYSSLQLLFAWQTRTHVYTDTGGIPPHTHTHAGQARAGAAALCWLLCVTMTHRASNTSHTYLPQQNGAAKKGPSHVGALWVTHALLPPASDNTLAVTTTSTMHSREQERVHAMSCHAKALWC